MPVAISIPAVSRSCFSPAEDRFDVDQAEPGRLAGPTFEAVRIGDAPAQHLVAAAQPEDMPALAAMREDVDVPPLAPQKGEIGQGRLRSGQDDQSRHRAAAGGRAGTITSSTPRLGAQRVEIVEIRDARQAAGRRF